MIRPSRLAQRWSPRAAAAYSSGYPVYLVLRERSRLQRSVEGVKVGELADTTVRALETCSSIRTTRKDILEVAQNNPASKGGETSANLLTVSRKYRKKDDFLTYVGPRDLS